MTPKTISKLPHLYKPMFYDFLTWIYFFAGRTYFLYLFLYSGLEFTLTFLTHLRFNFTSMDQGKMFLFIGILMACVQGGYVRKIPPGKEKTMVLRGLLLIVPSFAIVGFAQNIPTLYVGKYLFLSVMSLLLALLKDLNFVLLLSFLPWLRQNLDETNQSLSWL